MFERLLTIHGIRWQLPNGGFGYWYRGRYYIQPPPFKEDRP